MPTMLQRTVKERPILMSGPMVRALLAGRKTQTRRVVKPQPPTDGRWMPWEHSERPGYWFGYAPDGKVRNDVGAKLDDCGWVCPYGSVGDRLWVRETWSPDHRNFYPNFPIVYRADNGVTIESVGRVYSPEVDAWFAFRWQPSIHMPRWASRLTLEITSVRVERLQDISEDDAIAEGVDAVSVADVPRQAAWTRRQDYARLWDHLNAKRGYPWASNPWVWVIGFDVITGGPIQ